MFICVISPVAAVIDTWRIDGCRRGASTVVGARSIDGCRRGTSTVCISFHCER
ncbi:MAG: hypothetical protein K6G07_08905 [Lachnospiraceae bacterium]|nr:hypothetical protein [Lachnospiraceae bacterium]